MEFNGSLVLVVNGIVSLVWADYQCFGTCASKAPSSVYIMSLSGRATSLTKCEQSKTLASRSRRYLSVGMASLILVSSSTVLVLLSGTFRSALT